MKKVYIAGPLRNERPHRTTQNIQRAREEAELFWKMGFAVLCPHLNTEGMIGMLKEEENFIQGDLEWLAHADFIVLLPKWRNSEGAKSERAEAIRLGIPTLECSYIHKNYRSSLPPHWLMSEIKKDISGSPAAGKDFNLVDEKALKAIASSSETTTL
jgi:nucleoside 2-deoxyribosyltransferase